MTYFDTAYILKCYVKEDGWQAVRTLARGRERIACSVYGRLEPLTTAIMTAVTTTFTTLSRHVFLRTGDAVHLLTAGAPEFSAICEMCQRSMFRRSMGRVGSMGRVD